MSSVPDDRKYAVTHEWAKIEPAGIVCVGISDHAQTALGDVVFVELPEIGAHIDAGDQAGVVESVKAASDIYAPVSGVVVEVNDALENAPDVRGFCPQDQRTDFSTRQREEILNQSLQSDRFAVHHFQIALQHGIQDFTLSKRTVEIAADNGQWCP